MLALTSHPYWGPSIRKLPGFRAYFPNHFSQKNRKLDYGKLCRICWLCQILYSIIVQRAIWLSPLFNEWICLQQWNKLHRKTNSRFSGRMTETASAILFKCQTYLISDNEKKWVLYGGIWVWRVQISCLSFDRTIPPPCFWHLGEKRGQNYGK